MFSKKPFNHTSDYLRALGAASHCGLDSSFQDTTVFFLRSTGHSSPFPCKEEHIRVRQVASIPDERLSRPGEPQLPSLALHLCVFISLHPHKKHLGDTETEAEGSSIAHSRPNSSSPSRAKSFLCLLLQMDSWPQNSRRERRE